MSQTLGEKLRAAREERGISIGEVAEQTRISPHYLASIENDDYKTLPGGIFNKGFVKSYGKYVGLDENEVLQDYARLNVGAEEENPESQRPFHRPEVLTDDRNVSTMLPTIVFAVLILAAMSAGILFLVSYLRNRDGTQTAATPSPVPANVAPANAEATPPLITNALNIELKAVGEAVWVSYAVDGANKVQTLAAGESVKVEPKDSFKLSYSKAKLPNLQIVVNGRQLAQQTASPKGTVEVEINKNNLQQILQNSQTAVTGAENPSATPAPVTEQSRVTARPSETPERPKPPTNTATNTAAPKPAATAKPKPSQTPIVVGRPRTVPSP
jgi:hypothetical protein